MEERINIASLQYFLPSHLNSDFTSAFGFFVSAEKKNNASTIIIRILCIQ